MTSKVNTVLITVLIAISSWHLKTTVDMKEQQANFAARLANLERVVYK